MISSNCQWKSNFQRILIICFGLHPWRSKGHSFSRAQYRKANTFRSGRGIQCPWRTFLEYKCTTWGMTEKSWTKHVPLFSVYLASSPCPVLIVKVNPPENGALKKPSHLTPTVPPVDPTLATPFGTPDPQSKRMDGSICTAKGRVVGPSKSMKSTVEEWNYYIRTGGESDDIPSLPCVCFSDEKERVWAGLPVVSNVA